MEITVNSIKLNYEVIGTGKPLIMVHGNGEDLHIFDELANEIKDFYKVYLIDSRNHGLSQKDLPISFDLMADDIIEFCKINELENVDFLGFSDGGIIGLKIAIKAPKLLNKMILCGANFHPKGVKKSFYIKLKHAYKKNKSPLIKLMLREPKFKVKDIKNISVKTVIIAGEKDLIDLNHTTKLHQLIDKSEMYILPDETHESYVMHDTKLKQFLL